MAKKSETNEEVKQLKTKVQEGKAIIGNERVLKGIKSGSLKKIFLANNCPDEVKNDILHYAKIASIPVSVLPYDNEELGIFCKKNFFVSVLGTTEE
jgi:large subunit ribosomal protein L30e